MSDAAKLVSTTAMIPGQMIAGNQEANNIERISSAVEGAAKGQQAQAMELAKPTTAELTQIGKQISAADVELSRKQALMSTLDPAFMEAGKQALALLRGQQAASLGPMQQERDRQRNNLVQRLQSTMGPGAESSAAGAEQLKQFDSQTAMMMNNAQQTQIQTLLGASLSARPDIDRSVASLGETFGEMNALQNRQLGALERNSLVPYAGLQYASGLFRAQMYGNIFRNGAQGGSFSMGSGGNPGSMGNMGSNNWGGEGYTGGGMPSSGGAGGQMGSIGGNSGMAGGPMDAGGSTAPAASGAGEMGALEAIV